MDDALLGITIGDIAGKGLGAAVLTSLVKNAVRAHATEKGSTPARILELTNEVVYRGTGVESFATVFFGVLDRETGCLEYANAGHTTGFVVRGAGVLRLETTGPVLGAFRDTRFEQRDVPCLEPDDLLFLYTDGIIEARAGSRLYGEERLLEVLANAEREPRTMISAAIDDVLEYSGGRLSDDAAILALSYRPRAREEHSS